MQKLKNLDGLRDAIKLATNLESVVRDMYGVKLTKINDDDYKALCPFHDEKTPSFGIRSSKQLFHCFGCQEGGDLFTFVQKMDKVDHIEAIKKLAEFAGVDMRQFQVPTTDEEKAIDQFYSINDKVAAECAANKDVPIYHSWVERRRFDLGVLTGYGVGFAAAAPAGNPHAAELELDRSGQWTNTIVVPIRDHYGRVTGFMNRMLDRTAKPKVIGPSSKHPLPRPPIYGLYEAKKYVRTVGYLILVEGEPDVWQMAAHGYRNVAALRGTQLTDDALALLSAIGINSVIVMADNDEAGRAFSRTVAESRIGHKVSIKIATLVGNGKDPDEILLADGEAPIDRAISSAVYSFEYVINNLAISYNLNRPTDKLDFLTEIKPKLANAPELERELASKLLSNLLGVDADSINDFIKESERTSGVLHNVHAERCVLKRMLGDEEFVGEALTALRDTDFYLTKHKMVFVEIGKLFRSQRPISREIVETVLENATGSSAKSFLDSICGDIVKVDDATWFLQDLRDKAIRRDVQAQANDAVKRLADTSQDAHTTIQNLSARISHSLVANGGGMRDVDDVVHERMDLLNERMVNPNAIVGYDLGPEWYVLNHTLHGLLSKRYVIISAPTGVGKTALACCLARRFAVDLKIPTLYFTFETGVETLTDRIISNLSGVPTDKTVTGYISAEEVEQVQDAALRVATSPLVMTERGVAFEECAALMRSDILKRRTKIVIVDYIQLMHSTDRAISSLRRDQELGTISRNFLTLAKELDIVLLVLAQNNRESAKAGATSKESIGESYKIIQDADVGLFLREKTKDELEADGPTKGNLVAQLAKHRHGRGGVTINILFDKETIRMQEVRLQRAMDVRPGTPTGDK